MAFFTTTRPSTVTPEVKDIEVVDPPDDSISRVSFCPTADVLAIASWNNEVCLVSWSLCVVDSYSIEGSNVRHELYWRDAT